MNYQDALRFLDARVNRETGSTALPVAGHTGELSLDVIRSVMHVLGDPQHAYRVVHITGTNGKGSVARMVSRLLVEHGLSVGTYTSPHLQRVNERLAWNGVPISDDDFAELMADIELLLPLADADPSWFELLTAAALSWFAHIAVDVAVIEVGLLGRYDATNVADADVAVVTNIGGDHTDFSPGWRHAVAAEKAGIIKPDSFLVLGEDDLELRTVFDDELRAQGALAADGSLRRWVRGDDFEVMADRGAVGGHLVDLRLPGHDVADVFIPLLGAHQAENAVVAVAAVEALFARPVEFEILEAAFAGVRLPGRFEVVNREPLTVLDGAHNPPGLEALAEAIDDEFGERSRRIVVLGQLDGRDPQAVFDALRIGQADLVVACTAPSPRAVPAATLAAIATERGVQCIAVDDVGAALAWAQAEADQPDDVVVVTGSLYVVGAARDALHLPVI